MYNNEIFCCLGGNYEKTLFYADLFFDSVDFVMRRFRNGR